jgi:hypothetical protein
MSDQLGSRAERSLKMRERKTAPRFSRQFHQMESKIGAARTQIILTVNPGAAQRIVTAKDTE